MTYCSNCGAEVPPDGRFCPSCGALQIQVVSDSEPENGPETRVVVRRKGTFVAPLLSLLLTGLGQMYDGQFGRGLAFLIGVLVLHFVGPFFLCIPNIIAFGIQIYAVYDAYRLAKEYNAYVEAHNARPW